MVIEPSVDHRCLKNSASFPSSRPKIDSGMNLFHDLVPHSPCGSSHSLTGCRFPCVNRYGDGSHTWYVFPLVFAKASMPYSFLAVSSTAFLFAGSAVAYFTPFGPIEPSPNRCASRVSSSSSHPASSSIGRGSRLGTATNPSTVRESNLLQPSTVRNGWLAVASISSPDASFSRYTGLMPVGNAFVSLAGTRRYSSSTDHTYGFCWLNRSSPSVTSPPLSALLILALAGRQPESLKSDSRGRLSWRCSTARESCATARTGTSRSRASTLRPRDISAISCWRFSARLRATSPTMSCR